jgi:hypothetical protein
MSIKGTDIGSAVMRELQAYTEALVTEADNAAKRSDKKDLKKRLRIQVRKIQALMPMTGA